MLAFDLSKPSIVYIYLTTAIPTHVFHLEAGNTITLNSLQEGLELFIEFLEMLASFLREVLSGEYSLPENTLSVILGILNELLSLTRNL